jgi:phage gpG-like protein
LPYNIEGGLAIDVGTNVEYAPYQEFGTGRQSEKPELSKAPDKPGIPARPYLRPALAESEEIVKQLLAKNIVAAFR